MAERVLVVIPTYNEIKNLPKIVPEVLRQDPRIEVRTRLAAAMRARQQYGQHALLGIEAVTLRWRMTVHAGNLARSLSIA